MKKFAALLALALAAFALVACGDSDDDTTTSGGGATTTETTTGGEGGGAAGGGGATVALEADPDGGLAYTTTEAEAKAGQVTIDFDNPQPLTHDVRIEDSSGKDLGGTKLIDSGADSATVKLTSGDYTFFCSVPGHREAGMEGTLTVK
jgi:uncharacterized cupredoxin-like copper-binding protein